MVIAVMIATKEQTSLTTMYLSAIENLPTPPALATGN